MKILKTLSISRREKCPVPITKKTVVEHSNHDKIYILNRDPNTIKTAYIYNYL